MGSDNHTLAAAKAAYENADFAGAAYHLACMYDRDRGVFVDTSKCIYWLKRAAELGHVMAMYELAVCHDSGKNGAEKDYKKALYWAERAKESCALPVGVPGDKSGMPGVAGDRSCVPGALGDKSSMPGVADDRSGMPDEESVDVFNLKVDELIREIGAHSETAFAEGNAAYEAEDYLKAVGDYRIAAEHGVADAAWKLSWMYENGEGLEKNEAQGKRWQERAAELGSTEAMYEEASRIYKEGYDGHGLEDFEKAYRLAKKVKESGELPDWMDIDNLVRETLDRYTGNAFINGYNAFEAGNYAECERLYRIAAEAGITDAQLRLGNLYLLNAEKDMKLPYGPEEGEKWIVKAADAGVEEAWHLLADMYISGKYLERNWHKAAKWLEKIALTGDTKAQTRLGYMYYKGGPGFTSWKNEAAKWFKMAAEKGDPDAQYYIGMMYYLRDGEYVEGKKTKDFLRPKSIEWFKRAAAQNHAESLHMLGEIYEDGFYGFPSDHRQAHKYYELARKAGYKNH